MSLQHSDTSKNIQNNCFIEAKYSFNGKYIKQIVFQINSLLLIVIWTKGATIYCIEKGIVLFQIPYNYQIINCKVINDQLYFSLSCCKISRISLNKLKNRGMNMNIPQQLNLQLFQSPQYIILVCNGQTIKRPSKIPLVNQRLYQDYQGNLYLNKNIISTSSEAFPIQNTTNPQLFYVSTHCQNYIIGRMSTGQFSLRSRFMAWKNIYKINYRPYINSFWICQHNDQLSDIRHPYEIILLAYCNQKKLFILKVTVSRMCYKKRLVFTESSTGQENLDEDNDYYDSKEQIVVQVTADNEIAHIQWISIEQLMYRSENGIGYLCLRERECEDEYNL